MDLAQKLQKDIYDMSIQKLACLYKIAAGIPNPMGGKPTSTVGKPAKVSKTPVMSQAPINDLLPKASTAISGGLTLPMQNASNANSTTNVSSTTQSGVSNFATLPQF